MARALRAIVAQDLSNHAATVPKNAPSFSQQPNELRVTLFQTQACQCDRVMTQMENSLFKNETSSERLNVE
jgi:hypothetical protein